MKHGHRDEHGHDTNIDIPTCVMSKIWTTGHHIYVCACDREGV